jgi:thymidine kinase
MSIHLIIGCMFSGKTTALINAAKMNKLLNKKVLMINYNLDNRYSSSNKMITI